MSSELFLAIPFNRKDELKKRYQLKWNVDKKLWFAPNKKTYDNCELVPYHIINLIVIYKYKDRAKQLGARWNGSNWYCSKSQFDENTNKFKACMVDSDDEVENEDEDEKA